ncbi:hypothetical protein EST38_g6149 [Candolleomyces aberdarensis]|uniref:Uncharacterized protein n=1 Tax=Candolleomyces aberdarensis TaxID=2316362 RepID=A0A4Q2DIS6_9AGAR|nr:hypothetical protein EST38_g6149 [Candolleomyces aberdarensis]
MQRPLRRGLGWILEMRPDNIRVRALFVENMSGPVLRMLGARFNIEPFFFSSSINWIPSRFQEEIQQDVGDHITLTLTFIKSMSQNKFEDHMSTSGAPGSSIVSKKGTLLGSQKIDTQAPLILYSNDFIKNIEFVRDTPTPFMTSKNFDQRLIDENARLLKRECKNLLDEIKRLQLMLYQQERRLKNVMNLVFSSVNIDDSKRMREMTEAAVRDSAAMKQIAYLTMIFLPASFVAAVFGMNVAEINPGTLGTVPHYVAVALPFTIFTAWIIIAFQSKYIFPGEVSFWLRLTWPFKLLYDRYIKKPDSSDSKVSGEDEYNFDIDKGSHDDVNMALPTVTR